MLDIRRCRKHVGIMLVLILLSFFCVVRDYMPERMVDAGAVVAMSMGGSLVEETVDRVVIRASAEAVHEVDLLTPAPLAGGERLTKVSVASNEGDRLAAPQSSMDDIVIKEQRSGRGATVRFIAIVFVLFHAVRVVYRAAIRRYGKQLIRLWQNIVYIHQIDGKKGNGLLYI